MEVDHLLLQVLREVSNGAEVMRYAAMASEVLDSTWVIPRFFEAVTASLHALDGLLGESPPKARARASRKLPARLVAKARGGRASKRALAPLVAPNKLPAPPDLTGLDFLAGTWVDKRVKASLEASACRALLLEVVRRAAFDWVLYRSSSKLINKQLAEGAYHWLFIEEPDSATWAVRRKNGKEITGFCAICDLLDLDPDKVRERIRLLTKKEIMNAGRPAERRKHKNISEDALHTDDLRVFDVDVDCLPVHDPLYSSHAMEG
jgi:hypothetical protein